MSYSVRYQVFVSSTFTDLVDERAEVIQAVWEIDCIPTGMEAFVASNENQWEVIKRVINECDYYVLIIVGRYGSVTDSGVSYTEKEYRYAKELGIPVLAFVHAAPDTIPVGKSERSDALISKLEAFRSQIMEEYPVRSWSSAQELGGLVSRSLNREIKINPRPGWIRNDGASPIALLEQANKLADENRSLREAAASVENIEADPLLERGADPVELWGSWRIAKGWDTDTADWYVVSTWDAIFRDLGPALINEAPENQLREILARFNIEAEVPEGFTLSGGATIAPEAWNAVLIQFRALGLLDQGIKKRGVNDGKSYWRITTAGDRHLVNLLARKHPSPIEGPPL